MSFSVIIDMTQDIIDDTNNKFVLSCQATNNYHSLMDITVLSGNLDLDLAQVGGAGSARRISVPLTKGIHSIYGGFDHTNLNTGDMWLYLDGVEILTPISEFGTPGTDYGGSLLIGRHSEDYGSHLFDGLIDEVAYFDKRLSNQEIIDLYNASIELAYNNIINSYDPIGYWRLGESSGVVATDEVGLNDGAYEGTPTFSQPSLIINNSDTSVRFPENLETNMRVSTLNQSFWNTEGSMVFNFVMHSQSLTDHTRIIHIGSVGDNSHALMITTGSNNNSITLDAWSNFIAFVDPIEYGKNYHIVLTKKSNIVNIYVNGVNVLPNHIFNTTIDNNRFLLSGDGDWGANDFGDMTLDDVSLFDKELTSDESFNIYLSSINVHNYGDYIEYLNAIHYYNFDEESGTIAYDSIGATNGIYVNNPTLYVNGLIPSEALNKAVYLSPDPDYIGFDSNLTVTGDYSFSFLMKPNDIVRGCLIVFQEFNSSRVYIEAGTLRFWSTPTNWIDTHIPIIIGQIYNLTITSTINKLELYVDSILRYTYNGTSFENLDVVKLGEIVISIHKYDGVMDEFCVFDKVLTQDEITQLYSISSYVPKFDSPFDIRAYYKLDETIGSIKLIDETGLYNSLSIVNTPNFERPALDQTGGTSTNFPNSCYAYIPQQDSLQGVICSFQYETYVLYTPLFSQYSANTNRMFICNNYGKLAVWCGKDGYTDTWTLTADANITYGVPHWVALQYVPEENTTYLWYDGIRQSQSVERNLFIDGSTSTTIASYNGNTTNTEKTIDNMMLFNTLSDDNVEDLYLISQGEEVHFRGKSGESVNTDLIYKQSLNLDKYTKNLNPYVYVRFGEYTLEDKIGNAELAYYAVTSSNFDRKSITKERYWETFESINNNYINLTNVTTEETLYKESFSVSFFLKIDSIEESRWSYLCGISSSAWTSGWRIVGDSTTQDIYFSTTDYLNKPLATIPRANYDDQQWHHYCFTYDGLESKAYLDGVLIDTVAETEQITYTALSTYFIGAWTSTWETRGVFDEFFLTEQILTENELSDIINFKNHLGVNYVDSYSKLVNELEPTSYWKLNDTDYSVCKDEIGYNDGIYLVSPVLRSKNLIKDQLEHSVLFTNSSYATIPTTGNVIETGTPFSVSLIFERTAGADSHLLNLPYDDGINKFVIFNNNNSYSEYGSIAFGMGDGVWVKGKIEVGQLVDDKRYHLTLVYDGNDSTLLSSYQLYLNGVNETIVPITVGLSNEAGTDLLINKRTTTTVNGLNGYISQVVLWNNKAITQQDNDNLYKLFIAGTNNQDNIRNQIKYQEPVRLYLMDSITDNVNCIEEVFDETGTYTNFPNFNDPIPFYLPLEHSTYFNGIDQKVTIPESILGQDFTIMLFINRKSNTDSILIQGTGVSLGIKTNLLNVEYTTDHFSSIPVDPYKNYHIAITSVGGVGNMFLNGSNVGTFATIPDFNPIEIGSSTFKGIINYVAFYDHVVDPTDILEISNEALIIKEVSDYNPDIYSRYKPIIYWDYQDVNGSLDDKIQRYDTYHNDNVTYRDESLISLVDPNNKSVYLSTRLTQNVKNSNIINLYTPFTYICNESNVGGSGKNSNFYLSNAIHSTELTGDGFGLYFYINVKFEIRIGSLKLRVRGSSGYYGEEKRTVIIRYDGSGDANGVDMWVDELKQTCVIESNGLIGLDEYTNSSSILHFYEYGGKSNKLLYNQALSDEIIQDEIIYEIMNQIDRNQYPIYTLENDEFLVRIDPYNVQGYVKTKAIGTHLFPSAIIDPYDPFYDNARLEGVTNVNGIGTSCKVYIFDKDMNHIDSLVSNEDGTFSTTNININFAYNIVAKSFTGECPEISGLVKPISD